MGSTGTERSLSSGLIPQWMKNRITETKFDFQDTSAMSPPMNDDIFYFKFKQESSSKGTSEERDVGYQPISQIVKDSSEINKKSIPSSKIDFSKHTPPCQQFLKQSDIPSLKPKTANGAIKIKSAGTDDGFKGEGAACGTSIIQVANQMVSGKAINRGFNTNDSHCNTDNSNSDQIPSAYKRTHRRGSKSLPASPLASPNSSPKFNRKAQNRFFTGAFVEKSNQNDNYQGSWILSRLLGSQRELNQLEISGSNIDLNVKDAYKGVEVNNVSMDGPSTAPIIPHVEETTKQDKAKPQLFRPKPSELREMNFWSPTSM